jgi:hypothetical protein
MSIFGHICIKTPKSTPDLGHWALLGRICPPDGRMDMQVATCWKSLRAVSPTPGTIALAEGDSITPLTRRDVVYFGAGLLVGSRLSHRSKLSIVPASTSDVYSVSISSQSKGRDGTASERKRTCNLTPQCSPGERHNCFTTGVGLAHRARA